jgi:hypothetical protein
MKITVQELGVILLVVMVLITAACTAATSGPSTRPNGPRAVVYGMVAGALAVPYGWKVHP